MLHSDRQRQRVLVWDVPTRAFHWLLVIATVTAFTTGFFLPQWWLDVHLTAGYTIIGLLIFRFIWAGFGSEYSRLGSFTYSASETFDHLRGVLLLSPRHYIGHNPAGAVMIFALAFVLCALVLTGLLIEGGEEKIGPLAGITTFAVGNVAKFLHQLLVWLLGLMVAAHIGGVIVESALTRENLVVSMLTGYKIVPRSASLPDFRKARWGAALLSWAAVIGVLAFILVKLEAMPPRGIPTEAVNPVYARTCGTCHAPYHPSLLPAASWQAVLQRLDDHFGVDNSSLPTADIIEIAAFLATHAAEAWDTETGVRFRTVSDSEPRRITETPYWKSMHDGLPEALFSRASVGSSKNCGACHIDAATGRFADSKIAVPKQ
jgi:cytochrome b